MNEKTWVVGEFVETVQLQVVCQTLINRLSGSATEIHMEHLETYGDIDSALQVFYEDSIREAVERTKARGITEGFLRTWFEKKLITPAETRGLAYRGATHTDGLINEAVDVLDRAHIIREERRGGGRWYELSHDRFIYPIKDSNKNWLLQYSSAATTREWLEAKAAYWAETHDDEDLLDQSQLPESMRWLKSPEAAELGYDPAVSNLVQASRTYLKNKEDQRRLEFENAIRRAKSKRRFRRMSYALGVVCIIAVAAVVVAAVYAVKAQRLNAQGVRLTDIARAALQTSADAQRTANKAQRDANSAAADAKRLQGEADRNSATANTALQLAHVASAKAAGEKRRADDRAKEVEEARRINTLSREAFVLSRRSESKEDAIEKFRQAIKFYNRIGDREAEAGTNVNIGEIYKDLRGIDRAEEFFNKAADIYRGARPDRIKEAGTLGSIGLIYASSSQDPDNDDDEENLERGKEKFIRALTIYRREKDSFGEAATLINLGDIHLKLGDKTDARLALTYYAQAFDIYERIGKENDGASQAKSVRARAALIINLADHVQELFSDEASTEELAIMHKFYFEAAGRDYEALKDDKGRAIASAKLAALNEQMFKQEKDEKKRKEYEQAVSEKYNQEADIYGQLGDSTGRASAYIKLGNFYAASSDKKEELKAAEPFDRALSIYKAAGDRAGLISAYNRIGDFYETLDASKAVEAYAQAIKLYEELGNSSGLADTHIKIGKLYHDQKDELKANQAFTQALELYPDDPKTRADRIAEIGGFYFDVFENDHDKENSIRDLEWFAQAAEIYRTTGINDLESSMYGSAANV